jgi:hypothetical protein
LRGEVRSLPDEGPQQQDEEADEQRHCGGHGDQRGDRRDHQQSPSERRADPEPIGHGRGPSLVHPG